MKTLIFSSLMLFATQALAFVPTITLTEGDTHILPITGEVSVESYLPSCPKNARCIPVTEVVIDYTLHGCVDHFASFHNVKHNQDGTVDVYVTPMNIANKGSMVTYCIAMPTHQQRIFVGTGFMNEENIRVHFVGTQIQR